jgi:undecaprenyl-diphosphatase
MGGAPQPVVAAPARTLPTGEDPGDPRARGLEGLGAGRALVIGLFQTLALLPGVSRSGSTISSGMFAGLTREAATRFSFLLSIPALVGANIVTLPELGDLGGEVGAAGWTAVAIGVLAAFGSGYFAIRYLIALVARDRLTGFARYCVAASVVGVLGYVMIGPPSAV